VRRHFRNQRSNARGWRAWRSITGPCSRIWLRRSVVAEPIATSPQHVRRTNAASEAEAVEELQYLDCTLAADTDGVR
jgi:hypothetical protein